MPEISVDGRSVSYASVGDGPLVIMLHAGGGSGRQWQTLATTLSDRFTCLMPDFHGHGATRPWQDARAPGLSDYAAIVTSLLARHHGPCHLIGHSHGGAVALTYAVQRPQTVCSLTLIEPTLMHLLRIAGSDEAWREAYELGTRHIAAIAEGRAADIADEFMPYWIGVDAWRDMAGPARATIVATMPAVAQFWAAALDEATPAEAYAQMRVPTLLLRGAQTRATTARIVDHLADLLPNSRLVEVAGAGHMLPFSHPQEVNAAIAAHLDSHPAGGS